MDQTSQLPGIGHNRTPFDDLQEGLEPENTDLLTRRDELLASCERMPAAVNDDEMAGRFADQKKLLKATEKEAEDRRKKTKQPYIDAGKAVDGFYRGITDPIKEAMKRIDERLTAYQRHKMEEERKRREEEERRAREEAERRQREAEERAAQLKSDEDLDAAIQAEEDAEQARRQAEETAQATDIDHSDASRVRGEYGSTASLRRHRTFKNLDRQTLDLEALRPHLSQECLEKAVRAYIKAAGQTEEPPTLKGVEIYDDYRSV